MGCCSSAIVLDPESQRYHGAMAPLQFSLGVDKVLEYWIRESGFNIHKIPTDIFRFVLNYTSFFDKFEFQKNIYWSIESGDDIKSARKLMGMGCYHNILFGSVLTGDIEYKCKASAFKQMGVGLVEPTYYEYLDQNMHTGKNKRCVFNNKGYYDCNGEHHTYCDNFNFRKLEISINMKEHTFMITDYLGNVAVITGIPDERVICFELYPIEKINVTDQSLQWVS